MQSNRAIERFKSLSIDMFRKLGHKTLRLGSTSDAAIMVELLAEQEARLVQLVAVSGKFWAGIQPPHLALFKEAKALSCNSIVLCLMNSAKSLWQYKQKVPLYSDADRAEMAAYNPFVDFVILFDEETPTELCKVLRPAFLVKGEDWTGQELPEAKYCGAVRLIKSSKSYHMSDVLIAYRNGTTGEAVL